MNILRIIAIAQVRRIENCDRSLCDFEMNVGDTIHLISFTSIVVFDLAEGCGMPLSMVRGKAGSFRTPNLQMSQTIESLQLICKSLNQSEKNWWLSPTTLQSIQEKKSSKMKDKQDVPSEASEGGEDNSEDDDEMIDLQANEDEQSCVSLNTVDDKNLQGSDGNTSEDESLWVVVKGRSSFENNDTSLTVK